MGLFPRKGRVSNYIQGDGAAGGPYVRQSYVAKYHEHPVLGSTLVPHATVTLTTPTVLAAVTVFAAQPDVPRNIILTGNAGANEKITINGLDAGGGVISEEITLNGATPVPGAKAFKQFTSFVFPAGTHTVDFVCGNVLGLGHKLAGALDLISKGFNLSSDAGTMAYSATVLASNTFAPAGTLDGAKAVDVRYFVDPAA